MEQWVFLIIWAIGAVAVIAMALFMNPEEEEEEETPLRTHPMKLRPRKKIKKL